MMNLTRHMFAAVVSWIEAAAKASSRPHPSPCWDTSSFVGLIPPCFLTQALRARLLGIDTIIVLEQIEELPLALEASKRLGIRPALGVRARLATHHGCDCAGSLSFVIVWDLSPHKMKFPLFCQLKNNEHKHAHPERAVERFPVLPQSSTATAWGRGKSECAAPQCIEMSRFNLEEICYLRRSGHWGSTSGDLAKFGLRCPEIVEVVDELASEDMLDCLQLLHFHVGSQVHALRKWRHYSRQMISFLTFWSLCGIARLGQFDAEIFRCAGSSYIASLCLELRRRGGSELNQ